MSLDTNKLGATQKRLMLQIYKRVNFEYGGDLNKKRMLICDKHEAKSIMKLGLVSLHIEGKQLNWYSLTKKGKYFFEHYIDDITLDMLSYFDEESVIFNKEIIHKYERD